MKSKIQFSYTDKQGNEIHGDVVNPGDWFGKAWLIGYPLGNFGVHLVVEADTEQDAIDTLADSDQYGNAINVPDDMRDEWEKERGDDATRAGNDSHLVDLDNVTMRAVPTSLVYTGDGLPEAGLSPVAYYDFINQ